MSQVPNSFVSRQPILDKRHRIIAYELLFRDASGIASPGAIIETFATLGAQVLLGETTGFLDVGDDMLMDDRVMALPRDRVVLALPPLAAVSKELEARCRELRRTGFRFCLRDVERRDPREVLYPHSAYATLDHKGMHRAELKQQVRKLTRTSMQVIAARVDTPEELELCRDAGLDLFQGYYFARPLTLTGRKVDPDRCVLMELLLKIGQDCDFDVIAEVFKRNADLGVSLLRLVNSGTLARSHKVSSVADALVLIGRNQLSRWLTVMLYEDEQGSGMEDALLKTAAKRGRSLEILCAQLDGRGTVGSDVAYLVGMLSLMDVLFGAPLEEVLEQVGAEGEIRDLLVHRRGPLGRLLEAQERLEASDFDAAQALAEEAGISSELLFRADADAFAWVHGSQSPSFDL